jgi:type III pantothenate kinase
MILALDIGNSEITAGVFDNQKLAARFRKSVSGGATADELGLFLVTILRERGVAPEKIQQIVIASVVPFIMPALRTACSEFFHIVPFELTADCRLNISIEYDNPRELGADRLANAIAVQHRFPGQAAIIVDFGTAITVEILDSKGTYRGGLIMPGLRLSMEALFSKTAKLPSIEISKPSGLIGKNTVDSIRSGLINGSQLMMRGLIEEIKRQELSHEERCLTIATGGTSFLFLDLNLFDHIDPDLVLYGLLVALHQNNA